jgi:hypothetical protein
MDTSNLYINLWSFCCFLKEGFYGQRTVTYTERFHGFVCTARQGRYEHRTSFRQWKEGVCSYRTAGFGNDLRLVSYHFPKPEIFRATFHAAHWHKLLRTVSSEHTLFNKAHYEGTKSSGGTVIYSVTCFTWNRKVHCRAHNSLSPVSTPDKVHPEHCLEYYFLWVWRTNYYWF